MISKLIVGLAFRNHTEEFTTGKHASADPDAAGLNCYLAAAIYLGLFVFASCQAFLHSRVQEDDNRFGDRWLTPLTDSLLYNPLYS